MEHLSYTLNSQQLSIFGRGNEDITIFLHKFFAPDTDNYWQLTYELQREFKQSGSPEIIGIAFDRVKYDNQTHKGSFRIVLDINFTFGCEDLIKKKEDQTSEWTFAVNMHGNTIHLYSSPYAVERSTADEF